MKKSLILLTVLLLAGTLAFALDVTPEWSLTLDSYATIGYDLNVGYGGINNANTSEMRFTYAPKATWSKGGEGLYGYIEAKDLTWSFINDKFDTNGTNSHDYSDKADDVKNSGGTVTAKVVWNSLFVLISNGVDEMEFNYADNTDGYSDVNAKALDAVYANEGTLGVGYASDMFSARLIVLSEGDFATYPATAAVDKADPSAFVTAGVGHTDAVTARTANATGDWAFGLWAAVKPMEMLSVDLKAYYDGYLEDLAFGGMIDLKPIDLISFSIGADAYYNMATGAVDPFIIDLKPALTVNLGDDSLTASLYYNNYKGPAATDSEMDVSLKFVEADADAGYLPIVGASLEAGLNNLAPATGYEMNWSLTAKANATFGALKPYAEFKMSPNTPNDAQMTKINAGVTFTGIPNTTITLDYLVTDLGDKEANTVGTDAAMNDKGRITLKTKIAF